MLSWILLSIAVVLFIIGSRIRPKDMTAGFNPTPEQSAVLRRGKTLATGAVLVALLSIAGGIFGPLELGPVTLPHFNPRMNRSAAFRYAKRNMTAHGGRAGGDHRTYFTHLAYRVKNEGDKPIAYIIFKFHGKNLKLQGPFMPGESTKATAGVPKSLRKDPVASGISPINALVRAEFLKE